MMILVVVTVEVVLNGDVHGDRGGADADTGDDLMMITRMVVVIFIFFVVGLLFSRST